MDSVDNSSGAPPTAATVMRLFPESNLGKPLMKRFLAEMVAANVDEESITAFLAMAAEFSISTKSSPASADFKEAREHLTATVKYFIELAAEAGAAGGANASVPAASPPVPATDKPAALKTPAAGAKRPSDATGGGGAAPKKANVAKHVSASAESAVLNVSIDSAGVRSVPAFLVGKSLHVQLYTPELIKTFRAVRAANDAVEALGRELLEFEPDRNFLSLTEEEAAYAQPTALAAPMDTTCGSRLFHKLEKCRSAAVALRDVTNSTQKVFWLVDHTQGPGLWAPHVPAAAVPGAPRRWSRPHRPQFCPPQDVEGSGQGCYHQLPQGEDRPDQGWEFSGGPHRSPRRPAVAEAGPCWRDHPLRGGVRSHGSGGGGGGWGERPPAESGRSGRSRFQGQRKVS